MPEFTYDPPISPDSGFLQTIRLTEGNETLGTALWQAAEDSEDGIAQILDFSIAAASRRQRNGKQLMQALVAQTRAYHESRKIITRRLWLILRQKRHIVARAFFASEGFVHTGTIKELLRGEDALVYVRTFN
jgi:GNAT superfamily N-acetyltransferase